MRMFTISILVKNQFGVLNRVTSMFRRRQFNISSLTVSETESPSFSRITVQYFADEIKKQQLVNQLYKLPDVSAITELDSETSIGRELLLVKVENDPSVRSDIKDAIDAFRASIIDYTKESMVIQLVGDSRKIDDFINLMRDYKILEICRTGVVALEKGATTIRSNSYF